MANDPDDRIVPIKAVDLPQPFVSLWENGQWGQPAEHLICELIPWLQGPVEFIETMHWMLTENQILLTEPPYTDNTHHEYRGKMATVRPDLPWLDLDRSLVFAVNRIHGDDLSLAMDFRTSETDPRVVASYWCELPLRVEWRLVANTFTEFLERLEMLPADVS